VVIASRYMSGGVPNNYGQFLGVNSTGFLGFRFTSGGNTHYGYIELGITPGAPGNGPGITFLSAAFENLPAMPIEIAAVPEPKTAALSLGALALGAAATLRRRKS
jgi:hypothetical protein